LHNVAGRSDVKGNNNLINRRPQENRGDHAAHSGASPLIPLRFIFLWTAIKNTPFQRCSPARITVISLPLGGDMSNAREAVMPSLCSL
jgi:hypothetical protein